MVSYSQGVSLMSYVDGKMITETWNSMLVWKNTGNSVKLNSNIAKINGDEYPRNLFPKDEGMKNIIQKGNTIYWDDQPISYYTEKCEQQKLEKQQQKLEKQQRKLREKAELEQLREQNSLYSKILSGELTQIEDLNNDKELEEMYKKNVETMKTKSGE